MKVLHKGMSSYTKLFSSILASTIWREDDKTRIVWITMLAMADKYGFVEASVPGLADLARVSVEDCRASIAKLMLPDPDSRSREFEGRRIDITDGGWVILNHCKYRAKMNTDERREYNRIKQMEHRQRLSVNVKDVNYESALSAHAEAEAYKEEDACGEQVAAPSPKKKPNKAKTTTDPRFNDFITQWISAFEATTGNEYVTNAMGRDGAALKRLLKATDKSVQELMSDVQKAWNTPKFWCSKSWVISAFCDKYNEILAELRSAPPPDPEPNLPQYRILP